MALGRRRASSHTEGSSPTCCAKSSVRWSVCLLSNATQCSTNVGGLASVRLPQPPIWSKPIRFASRLPRSAPDCSCSQGRRRPNGRRSIPTPFLLARVNEALGRRRRRRKAPMHLRQLPARAHIVEFDATVSRPLKKLQLLALSLVETTCAVARCCGRWSALRRSASLNASTTRERSIADRG